MANLPTPGSYWVTWPDTSNTAAAKAGALIWGPQTHPPAQVSGEFQAGPFGDKAAALAYEAQIGTGAIIPAPGTPIVGNVTNPLSALSEIAHWIGAFFAALTDVYMWISLGWILLGLILVIFAVWTLGREEGIIPNTAPIPVPLPI